MHEINHYDKRFLSIGTFTCGVECGHKVGSYAHANRCNEENVHEDVCGAE